MARTYRNERTGSGKHCGAHGTCDYCTSNRTVQARRALLAAEEQEQEWKLGAEPEPFEVDSVLDTFEVDDDIDWGYEKWKEREIEAGRMACDCELCKEREAVESWAGAGDDDEQCEQCGGPALPLGAIGQRLHFRCRNCGWDQSRPVVDGR
jgi:hypothetical protein